MQSCTFVATVLAVSFTTVRCGALENEWMRVPGGNFLMGTNAPKMHGDGESPSRTVNVDPFEMMKYEVSNSEFKDFVEETGYVTESELFGWSFVFEGLLSEEAKASIDQSVAGANWWLPVQSANWKQPEGEGSDVLKDRLSHPVVQVSWNDATKFCEWKKGRLPTEKEWEKAARGGKQDRMFPWGNKFMPRDEHRCNIWQGTFPVTNTKDDGYSWTAPVDAFGPQNNFGFYNMVGNVWEWTSDKWNLKVPTHQNPAAEDPNAETNEKTKRGGSFLCHKSYCFRYRVVSRSHNTADSASSNLGFRCARDVK
jgi:formylglycine-generating enzyme